MCTTDSSERVLTECSPYFLFRAAIAISASFACVRAAFEVLLPSCNPAAGYGPSQGVLHNRQTGAAFRALSGPVPSLALCATSLWLAFFGRAAALAAKPLCCGAG